MADFFEENEKKKISIKEKLSEHLALVECELEDGKTVSNLDGICQMLIERALNGDLMVVELINRIINTNRQ